MNFASQRGIDLLVHIILAWELQKRATYSSNSCLEDLIPLTLRRVDIVKIFSIGKRFESHALSTRVTSHPISRQAIKSELTFDSSCLWVRVMRAIAYV